MGLTKKIYVISCNPNLAEIGMDRMRKSTKGLEAKKLSLDWSQVHLHPVVAAKRENFEEGEIKVIPIEPIDIPKGGMVFQSFYGVNGMGHLSCVGCQEFHHHNEERTADVAMFQARIRAPVMEGDLLGQVLVVPQS